MLATIIASVAAVLAAAMYWRLHSSYFRLMTTYLATVEQTVRLVREHSGLQVKITELRAANTRLFEQHSADTQQMAEQAEVTESWIVAYEKLVDEIEGDDDDDDDWPGDDDEPPPPDDDDMVVTQSDEDKVVTDDMLRPSAASRDWLASNDIEWTEDDGG